jgi:PPK2 family polyphosphate:nucleotide phosphotransferase
MPKFRENPKITVSSGDSFRLADFNPSYTDNYTDIEEAGEDLKKDIEKNSRYQEKLYAEGRRAVLIIFQAMDAAGKDSTIKHVMTGLNPQSVHVTSFKKPSLAELAHDFLWRTTLHLPERGHISIFNRSYYEEVLVCKVHPEFVLGQKISDVMTLKDINEKFWSKRYESIREHEKHLHRNGTTVVKFFLYVSKDEQAKRFLERINDPEKNWKFNSADIAERELWHDYMSAYEQAIKETATEDSPWYVIPADNKWFMQMAVGDILHDVFKSLDVEYPVLSAKENAELAGAKEQLLRNL